MEMTPFYSSVLSVPLWLSFPRYLESTNDPRFGHHSPSW